MERPAPEILTRAAELCKEHYDNGGPASILLQLAEQARGHVRLDKDSDPAVLLAAAKLCKDPIGKGGLGITDGGPALVLEHLAARLASA